MFPPAILASGVSGAISAFRRINGFNGPGRVALYQPTPATMSVAIDTPATIHGNFLDRDVVVSEAGAPQPASRSAR